MTDASIENRVKEIGVQLLHLARQEEAALAKKHKWENALLDWCMANPELKVRAFRFIDVFPQLTSSRSVLQHIREYFPNSEHRIPASIRAGLLFTRPSVLARGAVHAATRSLFLKVARLFVAASNEQEVLRVLDKFDRDGIRCSIDLLGERTLSHVEADAYFKRYETLIHELGKKKLGSNRQNVSIKLSALDPFFNPVDPEGTSKRVRARLRKLVRLAKKEEVFVHVDAEDYEARDVTLKITRDLLEESEFQGGLSIGVVLQSYLKDAEACLDRILAWAKPLRKPLTIRLVRGAYWDQEIARARALNWPIPVFTQKEETDLMFERLIRRILDAVPKVRLACATHNIRSIATTMALVEAKKNIKPGQFEFQLLYGMGTPLMNALLKMKHAPRMYTPVGDPVWGMAYLVRRLLENVSQESFVRKGIHQTVDADQLLAAPTLDHEPAARALENKMDSACPPLPFFEEATRHRVQDSLEYVRSKLGQEIPLVIDGKIRNTAERLRWTSPNDNKTFVVNASRADPEDARDAIDAARNAFSKWSRKPVGERAHYLKQAASWMSRHRQELAAIETCEVGKPIVEADADVKEAIDFLNFYARATERLCRDSQTESLPDELNFTRPEPRGPAAIIAPWNFPVAILTGMSAAALATGNTVILKPAEQASLSGWNVFLAYQQAGIPDGVVNFLSGLGEEVGPTLVEDPRVAIIAFTGSKEVGLQIAARANIVSRDQRHLKKFVIEMGGKNAAIVDETADFDQAIPAVLYSAFSYAGQKCSALSRLIVLEPVYDAFIARLVEAAKAFPVGDPMHTLTKCGPVIDAAAQKRILAQIEQGQRQGRTLYQADVSQFNVGTFVPPTIIDQLPNESALLHEEIFGPVLAVLRAKNFDDALKKANNCDFALTGGLFSRTPSRVKQAKELLEAGNVYINRPITGALVGRHPFGGYKLSGTGTKAGSVQYLREFFIERTISENVSRHGFVPLD